MGAYLLRRLLLIVPTLWAIITINFFIVQIAPGGPVDQAIAAIEFGDRGGLPGAGDGGMAASHARTGVSNISDGHYRGGRGLDPEVIAEITQRYGFDKPLHERYFKMLGDYLRFDFGDSLFRSSSVVQLIGDSLPVSISLGLWSTLIIYLVSIPLGIRKAVSNGSHFDVWSSTLIIIGYAIPAFLFAILLIVIFAGGSYFDLFAARAGVSQLRQPAVVSKNPRLSLAYHPTGAGHGDRRFCRPHHAHQKQLSRRNSQAVRRHCSRKGR